MSETDVYFDINAFRKALSLFEGTHDFSAFGNQLEKRAAAAFEYSSSEFSSVRTVHSCSIRQEAPHIYRVDIVLSGALFMMVRNIIEACLACSVRQTVKYRNFDDPEEQEKRMAYENIAEISKLLGQQHPKRKFSRIENKFTTAAACGLCLEKVYYNELQ
jgi:tRNA pseudouridine(38-40) synthase